MQLAKAAGRGGDRRTAGRRQPHRHQHRARRTAPGKTPASRSVLSTTTDPYSQARSRHAMLAVAGRSTRLALPLTWRTPSLAWLVRRAAAGPCVHTPPIRYRSIAHPILSCALVQGSLLRARVCVMNRREQIGGGRPAHHVVVFIRVCRLWCVPPADRWQVPMWDAAHGSSA